MTHVTETNDTGGPLDVAWCCNPDHYADGVHPDPDPDVRTVTLAPGERLTYANDEPNADDIADALTGAGGT